MVDFESGAVITPNDPQTDQKPILQEDPFKPDQPSPETPQQAPKVGGGKSRSKAFLLIFLILLLVGGTGYGVYYWQHNQINDQAKQLQSQAAQINDLKNQVKDLQANNKKLEVTQNNVKIPELGISIVLPSSIQDLTYVTKSYTLADGTSYTAADLSTKSLAALDPACSPDNGVIGAISKVKGQYPSSPTIQNAAGSLVKQFTDYYIGYSGPQAACSDKKDAQTLQTSQRKDINQALSSVKAAS